MGGDWGDVTYPLKIEAFRHIFFASGKYTVGWHCTWLQPLWHHFYQQILKGIDDIAIIKLNGRDVVRHKLVQEIIKAY